MEAEEFKLNNSILYLFYQSVIQGVMLYNQICYYNNRKADWERLDSIKTAARKIPRYEVPQPSPAATC